VERASERGEGWPGQNQRWDGEHGGMPATIPVFTFLQYSAPQVEAALAQGQTPQFQPALPTWYDAFFTRCDQLGLLAAIEALPDPRQAPHVPLPLLVLLTICRFLHCHQSFRRMGGVLLQHRALLERLGVAPFICERGYYQNGERKPFDEERFSEVFRRLDPEPFHALLAQAVQALRRQHPAWFAKGRFLMDSNHFRLKGSKQEYKWCALMLWTPQGLLPVAVEFSPVPGDGETTIGQRLVARALATYGPGLMKLLIMDAGYLDGEWLRELVDGHQIHWLIKGKEGMIVVEEMQRWAQEAHRWEVAPPPKLDLPQAQLPQRRLCPTPRLYGFVTYGRPVNGCVVRDRYPPSAKHPQGKVSYEYLLTSQPGWTARQINTGWRWRWDVESTFGQMTTFWGLGQWQIQLFAVYRILVLLLALTYTLLQAHLQPAGGRHSLQQVADRLATEQREARMLVTVGSACVIVDPRLLNQWLAQGLLTVRAP
jgi:DDE family transposase